MVGEGEQVFSSHPATGISLVFLCSQLSCFSPRCLARRKIVERSIYGYKITHVKFETVLSPRLPPRFISALRAMETRWKNGATGVEVKGFRCD